MGTFHEMEEGHVAKRWEEMYPWYRAKDFASGFLHVWVEVHWVDDLNIRRTHLRLELALVVYIGCYNAHRLHRALKERAPTRSPRRVHSTARGCPDSRGIQVIRLTWNAGQSIRSSGAPSGWRVVKLQR